MGKKTKRSVGSVKIGHITYKIRTATDVKKDGMDCMGYIDYEKNEILLNKNVGNRYWDTLFHEITHGIYEFTGKSISERETERIANMWLMLFIENKWIMRGLLKRR